MGFNPFEKTPLSKPIPIASQLGGVQLGELSKSGTQYDGFSSYATHALSIFQMAGKDKEAFNPSLLDFSKPALLNSSVDLSSNYGTYSLQAAHLSTHSNTAPENTNQEIDLSNALSTPNGKQNSVQKAVSQNSSTHIDLSKPAVSTSGASKVAVLDDTAHGEMVSSIIANQLGSDNIIKIKDTLPQAEFDNLNSFMEKGLSMALEDKAGDLNKIAQHKANTGENISAVNISSGFNKAGLISTLRDVANSDPEYNAQIRSDLGLSNTSTQDELTAALIIRLENVAETSERYTGAKQAYKQAVQLAKQHDIAIVTAAGNENEMYEDLNQAMQNTYGKSFQATYGAPLNLMDMVPDITTNLYSMTDDVVTVGSVDDKGTDSVADDTAAKFSSRNDNITIATNGVNVPVLAPNMPEESSYNQSNPTAQFAGTDTTNTGVHLKMANGTSFSAPQVTSVMAAMEDINPNLSVDDRIQILKNTAIQTPHIGTDVVGSGEMNIDAALTQAQNLG